MQNIYLPRIDFGKLYSFLHDGLKHTKSPQKNISAKLKKIIELPIKNI